MMTEEEAGEMTARQGRTGIARRGTMTTEEGAGEEAGTMGIAAAGMMTTAGKEYSGLAHCFQGPAASCDARRRARRGMVDW
eukprot:CAMPEP_0181313076 /NCGR_PEP_ID=MMETSP1101-20121128/14052_1 /TAXON_ID=46948 /ORGANISM="Rhodomonas abbreviata, Strain Caron Lab Isolate" /LENGTH=80 /DNA_ID=CAMNT_0023419999 /DNA_START=45 /DNA_END=284 /DNA_ORIENTATION=-